MRLWLLVISVWVAACAPVSAPAPVVIQPGDLLPAEAQRIIDRATATAMVMATENAIAQSTATAHYQQTADAASGRATELHFQETAGASTQIARETQFAFSAIESAATASAALSTSSAEMTATAAATAALRRANDDEFYGVLGKAFWSLAGLVTLLTLVVIGRNLARRADKYSDPYNAVRIVRTGVGVLVITRLRSGQMKRELLQLAAPVAETFDTDEETADEADEAPIRVNGRPTGTYSRAQYRAVNEQDERHRKFILEFLRKAMALHGNESDQVPGFREMGLASETWRKAVTMLADVVETKRGRNGGTWLVGRYRTLKELWLAVGERRHIPRPPASEAVVEQPPAPEPAKADVAASANN